jgi:hypothetical protein
MLERELVSARHHGFAGHVRLLLDHGVDPEGDRDRVERLLAQDSTLTDQAIAQYPEQLARAADKKSLDAVA